MTALDKYTHAFLISFKRTLEYRASFFIGLVSAVFPIMMQYYMWTTLYGHSESNEYFGYSYKEMLLYILLSSIVALLVSTGFEWEISHDIKDGGLNMFVIKPIGYMNYRLFCFGGAKSMQLAFIFIVIAAILTIYANVYHLTFEAARIALFIFSVLLSLLLNFLVFFCLSMTAFWMAEVWGVYAGFGVLSNLLGGGLFPIEVFGPLVNNALNYLPFKYIIYFPITVLTKTLSYDSITAGLLAQACWIGVLYILSRFLWSLGTKKYVSIGG